MRAHSYSLSIGAYAASHLGHFGPEVIRTKGIDQVTVEDLVEEITPRGRAAVPASVKSEMLEKIKAFIDKAA